MPMTHDDETLIDRSKKLDRDYRVKSLACFWAVADTAL